MYFGRRWRHVDERATADGYKRELAGRKQGVHRFLTLERDTM